MNNALNQILQDFRYSSKTERDKGTTFESLMLNFFKYDSTFAPQFRNVYTFQEWATINDVDGKDTGIDLVAEPIDGNGFCAIQCKFYAEDRKIQKADIDSFFTASGKKEFTRRILVDTTRGDLSKNAEDALSGQSKPTSRLGLDALEKSNIDWSIYAKSGDVKLKPKKVLREHQVVALTKVKEGLTTADRGKLIMACGTGKTFTSLKIAEELVGKGGRVLYLVPSLSLMSQTVREWTNDAEVDLLSYAVCSDTQVGKRKSKDDLSDISIHDLAYPATTDAAKLAEQLENPPIAKELGVDLKKDMMTVVFSTYQSIQVTSDAQNKYGLAEFDLIICDEAHRTTGAKLTGEDESNFIRVHDQGHIKAKKRLYMTATPRIFGDEVKSKANENDALLCSMDDEKLYGKTLDEVSFSYAVQNGLLTDYKVIVLAIDEETVSAAIQNRLKNEDSELQLDDVTKIIGCYRALAKLDIQDDVSNKEPMKRAVAFCKSIASSELIKREFSEVVSDYIENQNFDGENVLTCEVDHVDGTFNAKKRNQLLDWLSEDADENECRILSNARCLSEGVDVPSLDAILFLHPRKSQVDVVQSVGRVMRLAEGKQMGYVILPVGIPAGMTPEEALNNNKNFKVVWQILNALRAHDDRFNSYINRIGLDEDITSKIEIVAVSNHLPQSASGQKETSDIGSGSASGDEAYDQTTNIPVPVVQGTLMFDEFQKAVLAKIVQKCGTRDYWEDWANDIADIAQTHITRITELLKESDTKERKAFDSFLEEVRDDLNEGISESDAIEMLAQHLITKPVFDALFDNYNFAQKNPVSIAMQQVLDVLETTSLDNETKSLEKFYESVKLRAAGIEKDSSKQKIIVELYDKFFRNAFKSLTERLGIVYTPVEVVDFIIHSVNDVLQNEFGQSLGSKGVHIIDPFTGTGTFITRLLQSGLIKPEELEYKFTNEIHANEIVLLAYYIAAINIESTYHDLKGRGYKPFTGICLTDTFQLYEKEDEISKILADNSSRRQKQKELDIRVIIGNPPYSAGQSSANDNNANVEYYNLDERIRNTYAKDSNATNKTALYDSYIRAYRWASDRIKDKGVVAFVTNAGWVDSNSTDGVRKHLKQDFSTLYIFHLRGNQRTSGERSRQEGGKIFGSGSRSPIAISILVKNPNTETNGEIYFYDIGDYLNQQEKLDIINDFKSINGITKQQVWQHIVPDKYGDWLNQRDDSFDEHILMGDKKDKKSSRLFDNYSVGVKTNRDAWCYNSSQTSLNERMFEMIDFYNSEVSRYDPEIDSSIKDFVNNDPAKISWSGGLFATLKKKSKGEFDKNAARVSTYRPFQKQFLYYDSMFNERTGKIPQIFPHHDTKNLVIAISGIGAGKGFSALMVDNIPCHDMIEKGQCFPLYVFDDVKKKQSKLFSEKTNQDGLVVHDGINDLGLKHFKEFYQDEDIEKEDVFFYIYGLLHSKDYRNRYLDNLTKQLARIPQVKTKKDFWLFSAAGRKLGGLHTDYESVEPYPTNYKDGILFRDHLKPEDYKVSKMKFKKKGKIEDRTTVIYNSKITMTDIPLEAYNYLVSGKSALEWVMERQVVKTDKDSKIVNDANLYATEAVGDPAYPLKLFQRVLTVSLETMKTVELLPKLEIVEPK